MVLIFDGNSEIGAHEQYMLFDLFKCLIISRAVKNQFFFLRKDLVFFKLAQYILSTI